MTVTLIAIAAVLIDWQMGEPRRLHPLIGFGQARLEQLSTAYGLVPTGSCALFQWVVTREANALHESLARKGILTRLFHDPPSLRFGLPGTERGWRRLEAALAVAWAGA